MSNKITLDDGDTRLIINTCKKYGLLRNEAAYVLATARWETAHTMKPVREFGGEAYLRQKKYYPHVGMGYVQLTWATNYQWATNRFGVDFVGNPRLLLEPKYAAEILVVGMKEGAFTGRKLSHFFNLKVSNWAEARRIVNGVDKKMQIAHLGVTYDNLLIDDGYGINDNATEVPVSPPVTPKPVTPKPTLVQLITRLLRWIFKKRK